MGGEELEPNVSSASGEGDGAELPRDTVLPPASKKYEVVPGKSTGVHLKDHIHALPPKTVLHFVHRALIFASTVAYVVITFQATYTAMTLLRGHDNPWSAPLDSFYPVIKDFLGEKTIRESPVLVDLLHNSTTPVPGTIFLHDANTASFTQCPSLTPTLATIYSDAFLRSIYAAISHGASYNITELSVSETELIAPIVDCHGTSDEFDLSSTKHFFLVRRVADPDHVSVLVMYHSNQQYKILSQAENSAAAVASLQFVDDMRASDMDKRVYYVASLGYPYVKPAFRAYSLINTTMDAQWNLQYIPRPDIRETRHTIETSCREGFYLKAESEQSNLFHYLWQIEANATLAVSRWRWIGKPLLHDSWAWVHGVQFFIGASLLANLMILCLATAHNFREGKSWVGDAFVSLSTSQFINGAAVGLSWFINEFWSLREWCLSTAFLVADMDAQQFIFEKPMRADLMSLYLAACGLIGHAFQERIDPLLAIAAFHIGYDGRVVILKSLSESLKTRMTEFATSFYLENASPRQPGQDKISPMGFWSTHPLGHDSLDVLSYCMLPLMMSLAIPILYILVRKGYRYFYPDTVHVLQTSSATARSERNDSLIAQKRVLTRFEVATGAKLEDQFGVVTDFETCIFIKGTKFASADAIYSTGFIIANKKYLLQASDYWSVVLMKVLGRRFRNIYLFDVTGSEVERTARLVYPHTLTVQDLIKVSVGVLS